MQLHDRNTLGINHGLGSAADGRFEALETKRGYSAFFGADDPRERGYAVNGTVLGAPLADALWRTNHGFDPTFLETAVDKAGPPADSQVRYQLLHDAIAAFDRAPPAGHDAGAGAPPPLPLPPGHGRAMGPADAVNVIALAGDKGGSDRASFTSCANASGGVNIVSAAFAPSAGGAGAPHVMYLAYEDGTGATHRPACCNTYVKLDLSRWFFPANAEMDTDAADATDAAAVAAVTARPPRPPVNQQITWLYVNDLEKGASFVKDVVGFDEVLNLKQKDECRIFHAAPGHYWGVCNSRPAPYCPGGAQGGRWAAHVTYTLVVDSHAAVDEWHAHLVSAGTAVNVTAPGSSAKFGCYAFNFYDTDDEEGLGCYRFEVQAFDDPAWPAPECKPVE